MEIFSHLAVEACPRGLVFYFRMIEQNSCALQGKANQSCTCGCTRTVLHTVVWIEIYSKVQIIHLNDTIC